MCTKVVDMGTAYGEREAATFVLRRKKTRGLDPIRCREDDEATKGLHRLLRVESNGDAPMCPPRSWKRDAR